MKKYLLLIFAACIVSTVFSQENDTLMDYSLRLIRQQQFAKAIPYLKKFRNSHPDHLNAQLQLAFCYSQVNQTDKSIELYQRIVEKRPEYDRAYYMLANLHMEKKALTKAMQYTNKALLLNKNNPDYLLIKAQVLRRRGDMNQACRYYKKAKRKGSSEAKRSIKKYCK